MVPSLQDTYGDVAEGVSSLLMLPYSVQKFFFLRMKIQNTRLNQYFILSHNREILHSILTHPLWGA